MELSRKVGGGGFMDVIRCDEPSYLIWKWHPEGTSAGNNTRENSIRWGSHIRVKPGSVAVFIYATQNGTAMDYFEGPFDGVLETENLPVLTGLLGLAYAGNAPFPAEVYFINTAQLIQTPFAVRYFDVFDPRFLDYSVPVAVRGTITFKITDYEDFVRLHTLNSFSVNDFYSQIKDAVSRYVKDVVANASESNGIPVVQLERRISDINVLVENAISQRLHDQFGVTVSSVDISDIDIDKTSKGYQQLKAVTMDISTQDIQAEAEVRRKGLKAQHKIGLLKQTMQTISDLKSSALERKLQTETKYSEAAENDRAGFLGAAGAKIATAVSNLYENMNGSNKKKENTPPPIPTNKYYVAIDGQATGPYDLLLLSQMANEGTVTGNMLVWKNGMDDWMRASEIDELKSIFPVIPPIPNK